MLIAYCAEGAGCNSPAQRGRVGEARTPEALKARNVAAFARMLRWVNLEPGTYIGRAFSAPNNIRTQTWAVGPGFYIQRFQRLEKRPTT